LQPFHLVGGLEHEWIMTFHSVGNVIIHIIPPDEVIFFRGVGGSTTNQYVFIQSISGQWVDHWVLKYRIFFGILNHHWRFGPRVPEALSDCRRAIWITPVAGMEFSLGLGWVSLEVE